MKLELELVPYLLGGVCFLVGALILLHSSWATHIGDVDWDLIARKRADKHAVRTFGSWELRPALGESAAGAIRQPLTERQRDRMMLHAEAMREARQLWLSHEPWTVRRRNLEISGAVLIVLGVLMYKVMLISETVLCFSAASRAVIGANTEWWLVSAQCIGGSFCFLGGSWLLLCSANRDWFGRGSISNISSVIATLNVVGSFLFVLGSFNWLHAPLFSNALTPNYFILFMGFFVGSFCFAIQSWLMVIEIAESRADDYVDGGTTTEDASRERLESTF